MVSNKNFFTALSMQSQEYMFNLTYIHSCMIFVTIFNHTWYGDKLLHCKKEHFKVLKILQMPPQMPNFLQGLRLLKMNEAQLGIL